MKRQIGNLALKTALELATPFGYTIPLGGVYSWRSIESSGQEVTGNPPIGWRGKKYGPDGTMLPQYVWYDKELDILGVVIHEDYCQGQSSRYYFAPSKAD